MQIWGIVAVDQEHAMKLPRREFLGQALGVGMLPVVSRLAWAQAYPTRPVRIIVPFAPGGTVDILARPLAQKLSERLGKQFYIENLPGAGGNIGTGQAARAAPDGYTILFAFSSYVVNPSLYDKIPYDAVKDFEPVTLAVASTTVLTVNPSVPAHTVKELVDLIRANPGKYNFASPGTGTQSHLAGEQLRTSLGLDLVHVPYNGSGPSTAAVVAGHDPIGVSTIAPVVPHINAGTLRALAVTSKARSELLPDVPTMTEAGYPDIQGDGWVGVFVPARTPKDIVTSLRDEIAAILALPDIRKNLTMIGFEPVADTPEEFAARIRVELELWGTVIRASHLRVQ